MRPRSVMQRLGAILFTIAAVISSGPAWAQVWNPVWSGAWSPTWGPVFGAVPGGAAWSGCSATTIGGVAPSACRDWQANTTTGSYVELSNSCALTAAGATCPTTSGGGGYVINATANFPASSSLPQLFLIKFYSNSSTGNEFNVLNTNNYPAITASSSNVITLYTSGTEPNIKVSGGAAFTGDLEVAFYWDGTNYYVSYNGSNPVAAPAGIPNVGNTQHLNFSYGFAGPYRRFALWNHAFTLAQVQAASQL